MRSEKSSGRVLRLMAIFKGERDARVFQSELDLLAEEVIFSLHKLTVDSERIPVTDPSSYHLVDLMMRDYNHEDEEDSPEMTFTHTVTVSTVPVNDDLVLFQSPQTPEDFVINAPLKAHLVDKASCVGHLASLKDCPDNFLALDSNLHNQFDGRSVNPSGVPLFVIIPEEITSSTISSSVSSKIYTNVKVAIYFYNETVASVIVTHFKHFEKGPNDSVHMFLGASRPHFFVQCLNWKGVYLHSTIGFSPNFLFLLSAQRTLESWQDRLLSPPLSFPLTSPFYLL